MHKDNLMAFDNDHDTLVSLGFTADDIRLMRDTVNEANTYLPFRNNNRSAKN
jgi:hypothetical protein